LPVFFLISRIAYSCVTGMDIAGNMLLNSSFFVWIRDTQAPFACNVSMMSPKVLTQKEALTNHSTVHLSFTSAEPLVRFFYSMDKGLELEIGQKGERFVWVHAANDGPHSVQVRAMDAAGNALITPCSNVHWILDTQAPRANITGGQGITQHKKVELRTGTSEPLAGIQYSVDGSEVKWISAPQSDSIHLTVVDDGTHWLVIWGVDLVGNFQEKGFNYTWVLDTTAPTVVLIGLDRLPMSTKDTSVSFTVFRSEANASVWWAVDSAGWTMLLDTESSFNAYVGGDGMHVLRLKAADVLGNEFVNSTAWQWMLDTSPPTSTVKGGPTSPWLSSSANFQLGCTSSSPGGASDCARYEYTITVALSSGCDSLATHSGEVGDNGVIQLVGIRSGENTLTVSAIDGVGLKQVVAASFSWTVQLASVVLDVQIMSGPPTVSAWKVATFHLYALSNGTMTSGARFEVKLDDGPWSDGSLLCEGALCNYSTPVLAFSPHELLIRAKDAGTGVAGAPALWRWKVDECRSEDQYAVVNISDGGSLTCNQCPEGGDCRALNATALTLVAKPGWWVPPQGPRLTLYPCPFPGSCTGGHGNVCDEDQGFANSTVCGQCVDGSVRRGDTCVDCPPIGHVLLTIPFSCFCKNN
jgi:hypothetical protein